MRSEFKAKLLQHLLSKNEDKGFTLIELLVVIIIIGILAAIALPSFLNQANKARQSEAKTYAGTMNRSQQAYFLEKSTFTSSIDLLGLGIKQDTENYEYFVSTLTSADTSTPATTGGAFVNNYAVQKKTVLKGYAGTTWVGLTSTGGSEATTLAVLCENRQTGQSVVSGSSGTNTHVSISCNANMDAIS